MVGAKTTDSILPLSFSSLESVKSSQAGLKERWKRSAWPGFGFGLAQPFSVTVSVSVRSFGP
jgi:hypothetical protein